MDLSDFGELRDVIGRLAIDAGKQKGIRIDSVAIDRLARPGLNWDPQELADVDLVLLEETVLGVIDEVPDPEPGHFVTADQMALALKRSKCHYLWFC